MKNSVFYAGKVEESLIANKRKKWGKRERLTSYSTQNLCKTPDSIKAVGGSSNGKDVCRHYLIRNMVFWLYFSTLCQTP